MGPDFQGVVPPNLNQPLPMAKRREMLAVWLEERRLIRVAEKCNVSYPTAQKYRRVDEWDREAEELDREFARMLRREFVKDSQTFIKIAKARVSLLSESLTLNVNESRSDKSKLPPWDSAEFDRLVRLIARLFGEPDSLEGDIDGDNAIRSKADLRRALRECSDAELGGREDSQHVGEDSPLRSSDEPFDPREYPPPAERGESGAES